MVPMGKASGHVASRRQQGGSLIEILLGLIIVAIAAIGTLQYFAYGKGSIAKQGNRRAALERARERLEQLMAATVSGLPPQNGSLYYCSSGNPCAAWTVVAGTPGTQSVTVDDLANQPMATTVQWVHDSSAGTPAATLDTIVIGVKVWFVPGSAVDNNFNRVYVRTLRTP